MKEREEGEITLSSKLKDKGFKFNETVFEKAKKMAESTFQRDEKDDRFWEPKRDKSGNGYATIRFLPDKNLNADFHVLEFYQHYFEASPGKWIIENCPTTVGDPCPICEANTVLWKTKIEANQSIAKDRKRNRHRICNVLVVNDPVEPENNGKVFLFEIPTDLYKKVMEKLFPKFPDEAPMNVFNPFESSDFKIKITTEVKSIKNAKRGVRNFSSSTFMEKIEPIGDEKKVDELWRKCWDLKTLLTEKKYGIRSYVDIKKKFDSSVGGGSASPAAAAGFESPETAPDIKNVNQLFERAAEEKSPPPVTGDAPTDKEIEEIQSDLAGMEEGKDDDMHIDPESIFND
jgi:hypothetical protein